MPENNFISAVKGYLRLRKFPLDASSVYADFNSASNYAANDPTAYPGQLVAVVDEVARQVIVYQLGFNVNPESTGLVLQPISTADDGEYVKTINGIAPVNGNITIDLPEIDRILTFLSFDEEQDKVIFEKQISINGLDISDPNDVVSLSYLEATVDNITKGTVRTIEISFNHTGGSTQPIIPAGSVIKKAVVEIIGAFDGTIEILVGNEVIFTESDIFETIVGTYVAEPFLKLPTDQVKYPITINVTGATQGTAKFYLDFNIDFIF
jgi:hypothetical protein